MNKRLILIKNYAKFLEPNKRMIIPHREYIKRAVMELITKQELHELCLIFSVTIEDITDYIQENFQSERETYEKKNFNIVKRIL